MIKEYNKIKEALNNLNKLKKLTAQVDMDNPETLNEVLGVDLEDLKNIVVPSLPKPQVQIKFKNESANEDPNYFYDGDSGFDLRANIPHTIPEEVIIIKAGKYELIDTGLYFELPRGYELQVRPRSGLAANYGITVLNSPGTVDSNYRGEVKVILINLGENDFIIHHGDRIAQGVISSVLDNVWGTMIRVDKLNSSNRASSGFGSTGKK